MKEYGSSPLYYGGELQHHGILGQKWGVRRYQNKDGTLTEEGKKRYSSESEQKKFSDLATGKNRSQVANSPQVRHAALKCQEAARRRLEAQETADEFSNKFYSDKDLFEQYARKAAKKLLSDEPDIAEYWTVDDVITLSDLLQNDYDPYEVFLSSGDKRARPYREAEKNFHDSADKLFSESERYTDTFLGSYGDKPVESSKFANAQAKHVVELSILNSAERLASTVRNHR